MNDFVNFLSDCVGIKMVETFSAEAYYPGWFFLGTGSYIGSIYSSNGLRESTCLKSMYTTASSKWQSASCGSHTPFVQEVLLRAVEARNRNLLFSVSSLL